MRTKLIPAVLATLLSLPQLAPAQNYPAETYIAAADVEVRSGPSMKSYPTLKLHQGDRVVVLRECKAQPGEWLEIKPPSGSFSWVNAKYVKQIDPHLGYVDVEAGTLAQVLPGSSLMNQKPDIKSMEIDRGTIVVIVAGPHTVAGETWLPIQPHPSEVRYLPVSAVRPPTQVASANASPNWTLSNSPSQPPSDPMLAEADRAWQTGDLARARQKYQEVVNRPTSDPKSRAYAQNRLASLNQSPLQPGNPAQQAANPLVVRPVANATTTTALSPSPPPAPSGPVTTKAAQWSTYGILRPTSLQADGQALYRLETTLGQPLAYVTAPAGKSLRDYIGKTVCVYGPTIYRGDNALRMEYIVASHVALPSQ